MNHQMNPKGVAGCLAILAVAALLVSYWAVGSVNPLAVYASDSLLAKIVVSLLAGMVVLGVVQLGFISLLKSVVGRTSNKPAEDVICPGCGLPLLKYISSHGIPIACPKCKNWWHNGFACYNKDMPKAKISVPLYLCPRCRSISSQDLDLFDDGEFIR